MQGGGQFRMDGKPLWCRRRRRRRRRQSTTVRVLRWRVCRQLDRQERQLCRTVWGFTGEEFRLKIRLPVWAMTMLLRGRDGATGTTGTPNGLIAFSKLPGQVDRCGAGPTMRGWPDAVRLCYVCTYILMYINNEAVMRSHWCRSRPGAWHWNLRCTKYVGPYLGMEWGRALHAMRKNEQPAYVLTQVSMYL